MIRRVVVPPILEPISLADAKAHLRVETTDEDGLIAGLIAAARNHVETITGRFLMRQTIDVSFDAFDDILELGAPLVSVVSVTYIDEIGATQTVPSPDYVVVAPNTQPEPIGYVQPAYGKTWPTAHAQASAVTIRALFGAVKAADVPAALRAAMLLHVADLYENREAQSAVPLAENLAASRLLAPWVLQWF